MADSTEDADFEARLAEQDEFDYADCVAALRGERVPHVLGTELHRLCIIRGIRYHSGFGNELHGVLPEFTRALNARKIMDNVVPEIKAPEEVPYCIWHPVTASEDTYRAVAQRYPQMIYSVGRACAVAGYTQLFLELDILPEVHIAEEARECGNIEIHDAIVSQPVRYNIMNDYERSVAFDDMRPAFLNGDTEVAWMLDIKQKLNHFDRYDFFIFLGYARPVLDITEDMLIDEFESERDGKKSSALRDDLRLLYEPLPADLPTVQKDLLILMAAYLGNVDRYVRLRRPEFIPRELECCVRGIYHNTLFAVWWSKQPYHSRRIEAAINASFIMNNVLSRAPFRDTGIPYLIWWPTIAQESTYRHLAKIHPEMLPQIVRACIYGGYPKLFHELLPLVTPDQVLLREAECQSDPIFSTALRERVKELDITPEYPSGHEHWKGQFYRHTFGRSCINVTTSLDENYVGVGFESPYDGIQCDAKEIEMMMCLPDSWKYAADEPHDGRRLDYEEWPKEWIHTADKKSP